MGTSLIRISVIASRSGNSESDNKNDQEYTEKTNECHLLETPPASIKHNTKFSLTSSLLQKAAKIGKFAKVSDRRSQDERPVFSSHVQWM
ncbi:hypothetical protein ACKWTF_002805 [Chironomus riparius]